VIIEDTTILVDGSPVQATFLDYSVTAFTGSLQSDSATALLCSQGYDNTITLIQNNITLSYVDACSYDTSIFYMEAY
jgi:hypothetical protein